MAAFENAEAGGLAEMQAPAPVHELAVPAPLVYNTLPLSYVAYPYTYAAYPNVYAYNAYPYTLGAYAPYAYAGIPVATVAKAE